MSASSMSSTVAAAKLPQVCYHPQLGPIQTCDTCMVEVDGKLGQSTAPPTFQTGMSVSTNSADGE